MKSIIARYDRALENLSEARHSFQMLTEAAPLESVDLWKANIEEVEAVRSTTVKSMDMLRISYQKRWKTSRKVEVMAEVPV